MIFHSFSIFLNPAFRTQSGSLQEVAFKRLTFDISFLYKDWRYKIFRSSLLNVSSFAYRGHFILTV